MGRGESVGHWVLMNTLMKQFQTFLRHITNPFLLSDSNFGEIVKFLFMSFSTLQCPPYITVIYFPINLNPSMLVVKGSQARWHPTLKYK